ncbi:MAG: hypothetical protein EBR54_09845 [Flavobacteriia bacterium]|nr:hypothetical protein [Flavobacteriia bacterium]
MFPYKCNPKFFEQSYDDTKKSLTTTPYLCVLVSNKDVLNQFVIILFQNLHNIIFKPQLKPQAVGLRAGR